MSKKNNRFPIEDWQRARMGKRSPLWKGDAAGIDAFHKWIKSKYGSADRCQNKNCEGTSKNYDWAKKRGKPYAHKKSNFLMLCRSCHRSYDLPPSKAKGGYRGVRETGDKWYVYAKIKGKSTYVGAFQTKVEAALAYNKVATKAFGKMATLNVIKSSLSK